ncbi:MAG: metal ABC transporter substrate-binding protein, partial [Clostridia bacterium]|nr:metal ABC transporter substrate-binding protein [Clostridia bacterium]
MKKKLSLLLALLLLCSLALTACSSDEGGDVITVKVGASITPHAEILEAARADFEAKGYKLEIMEYTDYVQPNLALNDGSLDANYFQHQPYLDSFNQEHGTEVVSIGTVHYEPIGIYPGKCKALADLADGATVAVPNDATNEARALLLLEANGLIDLRDDAGLNATALDIVGNPKNLKIEELEAAQVAFALQDVDIAVINGNYAIDAGLEVSEALAVEAADGAAAEAYV